MCVWREKEAGKKSSFFRLGRGWSPGLPERSVVGGKKGNRCAVREAQDAVFTSRLIPVEDANGGGFLSRFRWR